MAVQDPAKNSMHRQQADTYYSFNLNLERPYEIESAAIKILL